NMSEKTIKTTHEKQKIASLAASCVQDDDMIKLDAGSTTLEKIPFLVGKQNNVETNSLHQGAKLSDMEIATIFVGGTL
ncbi:DeoR family transcriptional regulator, partial [Enterococcus faecalis]